MSFSLILQLPFELLLDVTDRLDLQDKVRLRLVNRHLRDSIKMPTREQYLRAENSEWAIAQELFTCSGCDRFRHLLKFANDMRKGKCARRGLDADKRLCLECGVDKGRYSEGTEVAVLHQHIVLVAIRRTVTDQHEDKTVCGSPKVHLEWTDRKTLSGCQPFEHDWPHSERNFVEGERTAEYGVWIDR